MGGIIIGRGFVLAGISSMVVIGGSDSMLKVTKKNM